MTDARITFFSPSRARSFFASLRRLPARSARFATGDLLADSGAFLMWRLPGEMWNPPPLWLLLGSDPQTSHSLEQAEAPGEFRMVRQGIHHLAARVRSDFPQEAVAAGLHQAHHAIPDHHQAE